MTTSFINWKTDRLNRLVESAGMLKPSEGKAPNLNRAGRPMTELLTAVRRLQDDHQPSVIKCPPWNQ
jgi:hypothetical protein